MGKTYRWATVELLPAIAVVWSNLCYVRGSLWSCAPKLAVDAAATLAGVVFESFI